MIETRNIQCFKGNNWGEHLKVISPPFFVVLLLTANLPNWRLRVLDPIDHNHIHCRFPNRKCALYVLCCCPDWKRGRHCLMAINSDSARRRINTFITPVPHSFLSFTLFTLYGFHFQFVTLSSCQLPYAWSIFFKWPTPMITSNFSMLFFLLVPHYTWRVNIHLKWANLVAELYKTPFFTFQTPQKRLLWKNKLTSCE